MTETGTEPILNIIKDPTDITSWILIIIVIITEISIKDRISKLNKNPDIKTIEDDIALLRYVIESYFKKLVG